MYPPNVVNKLNDNIAPVESKILFCPRTESLKADPKIPYCAKVRIKRICKKVVNYKFEFPFRTSVFFL